MENELQEIIKRNEEKLKKMDRIDTCDHSLLPKEYRLWCEKRNKTLVRAYCEICNLYKNKELGIGVN